MTTPTRGDRTESGPALDVLRESEARFAGLLAIAADAIITVDEEQRIVHFNRGAEEIFGYAAEEVIGRDLNLLIPPRYRAAHPTHVARFAASAEPARRMGHRQEVAGLRKSGVEFPAEASIAKIGEPGRRLFAVVLRDVTDRKRGEQNERFLSQVGAALASSLDYEATLRTVASLPVPWIGDCCLLDIVEGDGTERSVLRRLTSGHADPLIARRLREVENEQPLRWNTPSAVVDVLRTGNAYLAPTAPEASGRDPAFPLLRSIGIRSAMIVPLRAHDRMVGALSILSTDDARRYGELDLALARDYAVRAALAVDNARLYRIAQQANRARDEVLGVVSHDLRNPLSAISMCTRVLLENPPDGDEARRDLLSAIDESADWMGRMIQDLLDVSNIEAGRLSLERRAEPVESIIQRTMQMFAGAAGDHGIVLEASIEQGLPAIDADPERVLQVIANLVANAVKFTPTGGRISLVAGSRDGQVGFSVTDSGPGIPADDVAHIFDRYWHARRTARTTGSGLGLAIARGIVEAHGGRIGVESVAGRGSTFWFTIPVVATPA